MSMSMSEAVEACPPELVWAEMSVSMWMIEEWEEEVAEVEYHLKCHQHWICKDFDWHD